MIAVSPAFITGESAYSYIARCFLYSPYNSNKQRAIDVFGSSKISLSHHLGGSLYKIAMLARCSEFTLLNHATPYPLISFCSEYKPAMVKFQQHMLYGAGEVKVNVGQSPISCVEKPYLKACAVCFKEDEAKHGVGYWHIEHQLEGVAVCGKHNVTLSIIECAQCERMSQYLLPIYLMFTKIPKPSTNEQKLSQYVISLYRYLTLQSPVVPLRDLYQKWLIDLGYNTESGILHADALYDELKLFWGKKLAMYKLSDSRVLSKLVHQPTNHHYVQHALLMAFLTTTPEQFFECNARTKKHDNNELALGLLIEGNTLRDVSEKTGLSRGFIKQLALRHGVQLNRLNRRCISSEGERDIWRKAFIGMHRQDIANYHSISVSIVEEIIQSHRGLSSWRHHLLMVKRKKNHRDRLQSYMLNNPSASRKELRVAVTGYKWLLNNDKDWLYAHLPAPLALTGRKKVDWSVRDKELCRRIFLLQKSYKSLTAIDRAINGHKWLLQQQVNLPLALKIANYLINNR